jgi:hypothetical protein
MRVKVAAFVFCCLLSQTLRAQIIPEALRDFPAQTESLEYDNLATLRTLPNYNALKQRFSGKPLQRLKTALTQIDVPESAVAEIIMATNPTGFYGLISGTFNDASITKNAVRKGCSFIDVEDNKILVPTSEMAVLFLGNSLAAFGTPAQIKVMLETRKGAAPSLNSKTNLVNLLNQTDRKAPVRGISSGGQIAASLSEAMQGESSLNIDWSRLASNISAFSYSVKLDTKAHVAAKLQCQSAATAAILHQTLSALGALQSMAPAAAFENLEVSSSGVFIDLKMDTPLPAPE